ncbi:MAG: SusD/RagB family nutrient-binding outer membrane lipoprotein [Bacteroidales bacterium]
MRKYILMLLLGSITLACTDHFEDINTDKSGIPTTDESTGETKEPAIEYLALAQRAIYSDDTGPYPIAAWVLQVQSNLNVDIWSGYLASGTNFLGGINNQSYALVEGWNGYMFEYWGRTMGQVKDMTASYDALPSPGKADKTVRAMGIVTRILASVRTVDMYGTLPYTSFGGTEPAYDSMEEIYNHFFSELDEAVTLLEAGENVPNAQDKDLFFGGNREKWLRLANSMRLRIALRIVKADPALAKQEAEKAIAQGGGMIVENTQNAGFNNSLLNGLCVLAQGWGDTRMSADMESILTGYEDPRLPALFSKNDGKYRGVRVGSVFSTNSGALYSSLGTAFPLGATYEKAPMYLFTAAETHFLLAEAALRGYAGAGSAEANYNNGITRSMEQWDVTDPNTINDYLNSDATFADWVSGNEQIANSVSAQSKVTPKFAAATSNEEKLEKIITQKWIAMFPAGSSEAWSEYRRTGYPRLIPPYRAYSLPRIKVSYGPGEVNNAKKVRLAQNEYDTNYTNVDKAVTAFFNGVDGLGTPVWWDVDVPNL